MWLRSTVVCLGLILCIRVVQSQGDKNQAIQQYADAGQQALATGRYGEAQANFEKLAKLEPSIAEIHATLAVIYFKQRQYEQAIREIHTAQKLKPSLPKLDSLLGMSLAEMGRFSEALPGLEKGMKQMADTEVRRMCGLELLRAYTGLDRDADAVTTALALNKYYPDDPEILYHTGRIYGNIAYVVMESLHDKAPDSIWMLQAQGEAYESQKDYPAAIAAFQRVLNVQPGRPGIHYRMGRVYLRRFKEAGQASDRDSAETEFEAELATDPNHGNSAYELAQLHYDQGKLEQAQEEFQALLTRKPDFEEALVGLAGILLESQKAGDAIAPLRHAVQIKPSDEVAWYRLARALRVTGDTSGEKQAMVEFQKLRSTESARQARTRVIDESSEVTPQALGETQP